MASTDLLAVDDNRLLGTNNGERNDILDLGVPCALLIVQFVVVVGVHLQVVESKLLLNPLLEGSTLLEGERIRLGDDRHDIDNVRQLLEHDNVDGLKGVAGRLDEEQAAVNACVLDVTLTLSSKLLPEVSRMLILDVFNDGVPAVYMLAGELSCLRGLQRNIPAIIVDKITVARGINDVQS